MNIFSEASEPEDINDHPRVRAILDSVRDWEKQLQEANEVLKQAELVADADNSIVGDIQYINHQGAIVKSKIRVQTMADALGAARGEVKREILRSPQERSKTNLRELSEGFR